MLRCAQEHFASRRAAAATGNRRANTPINTHWHPSQTGSNECVGRDGGGTIIAHDEGSLEFAGQHIGYGYLPTAHTDGALCVGPTHWSGV
jgi:hypothetical protein